MASTPSTGNSTAQSPARFAAILLFLALAYFVSGRLGLAIPYLESHITLIWLPTGIAVAALWRYGYSCWPGVFIGALTTNYSLDPSLPLSLSISVGNTLGTLLAAWLLRRMKFHAALDRAYDILLLVAAAAIGMLITASGGVGSLVMFNVVPATDAAQSWLSWWAGDFVGVLLAAPLLLNISRVELRALWQQRMEFSVWLMATLAIYCGLFYYSSNELSYVHQLAFAGFPTVVWAAMRFGVTGSSLGVLLPVFIATLATANGLGPFYSENTRQALFQLWAFFFTLILIQLMVAALQAGRRNAERAILEAKDRIETIFNTSPDSMLVSRLSDGRITEVNEAFVQLSGYRKEEAIGNTTLGLDFWVNPDDRKDFIHLLQTIGSCENFEGQFRKKDGSVRTGVLSAGTTSIQGVPHIFSTVRDITERKANETKLRRLTELYAALSQCNQAIVRCASEEELFPEICRDAVKFGGMKMAWIGMLDEASQLVKPVAWFGSGTEYLDDIQISVSADEPSGQGTTGTAIRENRPVWIQDFQNDPRLMPWRERGARYGWAGVAALPLHRRDKVIGAFMLYSGDINAFDEAECNLLVEMAMDIDYALGSYALQAERNQAENALRESESLTKLFMDMAMDAVIGTDENGLVVNWNREAERMFGYSADQTLGKELSELIVPPVHRQAHRQGMQRYVETGNARIIGKRIEITGMRADGSELPIELTLSALQRQGHYYFNAFVRDLTERRRAEESMRLAAATFETQEAIMITDPEANILRVNQAFQDITGYPAEEVIGQNPRILQSGRHDAAFYQDMWSALHTTGKWSGEIFDKRRNGEIYPKLTTITAVRDATQRVTHYVAVFRDISNRKRSEQEIHQLAFYDPLTRLPNRRLLVDRLQQAMAVSMRNGLHGALLFLDLDHFKTINDTQGHTIGDLLLIEVARRLQTCVREGDSVARLGGDEFVVVLEELSGELNEAASQTELVAEKIRHELGQPYILKDYECLTTPSIGISLFRGHQESVDDLLKHADVAMYQAKAAGRNTVRFFDPAMQATLERRDELQAALRHALQREQFHLYYQIQVDSLGRPLGAEVLLRWKHPERGLVSPVEFIPLAEETGLIVPIGLWVLQTACAQIKVWQQNALTRDLALSVNVSAKQFRYADFVPQVQRVLQESGAKPSLLKLELTESTVLENVEDTIAKMRELKLLGAGFSMDDFGTGYSSLQYLKRLPLDQIKIDQSFVRDIVSDPNDAAIVKTIIAMSDALGLNVIAEGVETEAQREFLDRHGCHAFQGYLFSKPVPLEQFEALMHRQSGVQKS
ncbi:MAG: EAL domain-containing protein [Nitrosomonadales bacterium]|nr:EAL domain-containing protein [Nitrosomonadales bacterium]